MFLQFKFHIQPNNEVTIVYVEPTNAVNRRNGNFTSTNDIIDPPPKYEDVVGNQNIGNNYI